jgi:formate hydrogenlyase transcriptional activator
MQIQEDQITFEKGISDVRCSPQIIGNSLELKKILNLINRVAPTESTVLILGETGTGKELIARAIHKNSSRGRVTMINLNCAALPATLIESELFGHERGSFTGATERKIGKFELAHNSTIFLDEIGELPLELQVKLLRVLQEKEIERIGCRNTIKLNVRIIAATNRDLQKEVEEGRFRADLYYRLNIFPIELPPLRDRREDIPLLVNYFIQHLARKIGITITRVSKRAIKDIVDYNWPGNIRELEHVIERTILLSDDGVIGQFYLPLPKKNCLMNAFDDVPVLKTIKELERDHIINILKYCNGRISGNQGAAEILGVPASTLRSKMCSLGVRKVHYPF